MTDTRSSPGSAPAQLLFDINRAAHAAGTNAWVRDVLKRAFSYLSRHAGEQESPAMANETRGGTGDDCSVGKRGVWPPEGSDGDPNRLNVGPEPDATARRDGTFGLAQARQASPQEVQEACAQVADRYRKRPRSTIPFGTSEETRAEIHAEDRGENIAAETIARSIRALIPPAVPPSPVAGEEIGQHIAWLYQYVRCMNERNWRDMRDSAERQLDRLLLMATGHSVSSTNREPPLCSCKASARDGQHMAWCPATSTEGK